MATSLARWRTHSACTNIYLFHPELGTKWWSSSNTIKIKKRFIGSKLNSKTSCQILLKISQVSGGWWSVKGKLRNPYYFVYNSIWYYEFVYIFFLIVCIRDLSCNEGGYGFWRGGHVILMHDFERMFLRK